MGPPPKKNSTGKVLGIIAACLAGVFVLGRGVLELYAPGHTAQPAEYEVSLPRTLEHGKYHLAEDDSDKATRENKGLGPGDRAYAGSYESSSPGQLIFSGGNSSEFVSTDDMLEGATKSRGAEVAVPPREITPEGAKSSDELNCQVVTKSQAGQKLSLPMCAWADTGSGGMIADADARTVLTSPREVDLPALAKRVSGMRDEIRHKPAE